MSCKITYTSILGSYTAPLYVVIHKSQPNATKQTETGDYCQGSALEFQISKYNTLGQSQEENHLITNRNIHSFLINPIGGTAKRLILGTLRLVNSHIYSFNL